ncbi:baseplate assembly protein [Vibrio phage vB_VpaM_sm033]|nr:baseplate assembly protein [Vibrio phage vB_VpaM_sm033]
MGPVVRRISRGVVAVNKERDSDIISAWPIDLLPEIDDDLTDAQEVVEIKTIDDMGKPVYYKSKRSAVMKNLKWGGETNRDTSPDVRRGERIEIYQIGDDDRYYWTSAGLDDHLRRLETIVRTCNANPSNDIPNDDTNVYREEWSGHDGHITLVTTQANGEAAAWTRQYNCTDGIYIVEDEKGNIIYVDSVNTDIMIRNAEGTYIQAVKDTINMKCVNWNVDAENIKINSKQTSWSNSDGWTLNTGTFTASAGQSATLKAGGTVTINGSSVAIN